MSGGFYQESPVLEMFPFFQQHHIRFTTNGNRPTAQSRLYTEPLLLDGRLYSTSDIYTIQVSPDDLVYVPDSVRHCIVIRAAVFDENDECISEVATQSYFIHALGCDTHGLPVVSLCADSLDLFDYQQGIFVPGAYFDPLNPNWSGNYYQTGEAWERPINFEFYELNNEGVNQQAGLRTHGGNGRRYLQKCVKLYARESYGKKRFEHRFFESIPQNSFKHLVLKPFEASWNESGVNDHLCNQIASQLNLEVMASRPVVVYLNGEYWGIYYIHERPDERYLEDHFGVDLDAVNLVSNWQGHLVHGTNAHFLELFDWFQSADLANPDDYVYATSKIDVENFIDYQIFELFSENTDWPANNMRCWQLGDGPWRWIFYDGDACLAWNNFHAFDNSVYEGDGSWPSSSRATLFFRKLLENDQFKHQFKNRFYSLLNTVFGFAETGPLFEEIKQQLEQEIPYQVDRFASPESVAKWNDYMGHTRWFLSQRYDAILPVLDGFVPDSILDYLTISELFPNPSTGRVSIRLESDIAKIENCVLYDALGRQVYCRKVFFDAGENSVSFDLPSASGVYYLRIGTSVSKIVRQ